MNAVAEQRAWRQGRTGVPNEVELSGKQSTLSLHPDCDAPPLVIACEVARASHCQLVTCFTLTGDLSTLRIPTAPAYAPRVDGLWNSTCFEVFARTDGDRYCEVNVAPSTAWAVYSFSSYRTRLADPALDAPVIDVERGLDRLDLTIAIDLAPLDLLPPDRGWQLGLSAVIEELSGRKSYWALAHPPGPPDFHHADCFVLELPPSPAA